MTHAALQAVVQQLAVAPQTLCTQVSALSQAEVCAAPTAHGFAAHCVQR